MTMHSLEHIAVEFRQDVAALPQALRALLERELAAGNRILSVGHSHPAPPVGAFVMLAHVVTTHPRSSTADITFHNRNSSLYCGEFSDPAQFYFILEAPGPPPEEPDMDAIRETAGSASSYTVPALPPGSDAMQQFQRSRNITYSQWRDGIGFDLDSLRTLEASELDVVASSMTPPADWREVEALVTIGTSRAHDALRYAATHGPTEVRLAILERAPELVPDVVRTDTILRALASASLMTGLSEALNQLELFHPPAVMDALFVAILEREGDVAYHCAESLALIFGKIESRSDWSHRPLFLRFNTTSLDERNAALRDLKLLLGVSPDAPPSALSLHVQS